MRISNKIAQEYTDSFDFYNTRYENGIAPWHRPVVNWNLIKHYKQLSPEGQLKKKVLVPLCGKTCDIKYLADQGHVVVGVEFCENPCREIFERDNIEYSERWVEACEGKLFESKCGKIKVYCCDFFKFGPEVEGRFEAVWESGCQIEHDDRMKYYDQMKLITAPGCRWLTGLYQYDSSIYSGIPYSVPHDQLVAKLGEDFDIISVEKKTTSVVEGETAPANEQMMINFLKMHKLSTIDDHAYTFVKKNSQEKRDKERNIFHGKDI